MEHIMIVSFTILFSIVLVVVLLRTLQDLRRCVSQWIIRDLRDPNPQESAPTSEMTNS